MCGLPYDDLWGLHGHGDDDEEDDEADAEQSETARYECRCGASMTFREPEFDHLRWLAAKFGYRNPSHAIADIRDCCEYPNYIEVTG